MKTLTKTLVALAAVLTLTVSANAQQQTAAVVGGQQQGYVVPPQPQQNPFYFGMQLELVDRGWGRKSLRVVHVTWGSPAQRAGLEMGDEIRTVNGRGFQNAYDSFQAVRMLNQFVSQGGGPAPAVAASTSLSAQAYVVPPPTTSQPVARMVVRNVRNGFDVPVNVFPTRRGYTSAPAAAASTAVRN